MILLDSDHLSVLADPRQTKGTKLKQRLRSSGESIALPIVTLEEQFRGWLALIRRGHDVHKQIVPYLRFQNLIIFLREWDIVGWNEPAADEFKRLRAARVRIGTQDLKIASLTLANDALLLSANLRDFKQVPGLRVENWLAE
ncbi:MAG: type II toxin-antitoxin system VapC family toxin [Planctomycetales bacterium]|nr:type II toxin-antitoxin system VapC family toxin [Planctomycetales bacterium]